MSIPKIIHYCWFGGNPKPALLKKCIRSWEKYCPDYRIIEWNEHNFDVNSVLFCKQAYEAEKWAFITDYVRLKVLLEMGGFYMDTDVELIKSLDPFLDYQCFMGFQHETYVSTGLVVGAQAGNDFIRRNARIYEDMEFLDNTDSHRLTVCQVYTTKLLEEQGLIVPGNGTIQTVGEVVIFPPEYFCPYDHRTMTMHKTKNTVAIHHFASSWWDNERKKEYGKYKWKQLLYELLHIPNRLVKKAVGERYYEKLKRLLGK